MRKNLQKNADFSHRRAGAKHVTRKHPVLATTDFIVRIGRTLRIIFNKTFAVPSEATACSERKNTGTSTGSVSTERVEVMNRNQKKTCIPSHGYCNAVIAAYVFLAFASATDIRTRSEMTCEAILSKAPSDATTCPGRNRAGASTGDASTEEGRTINKNQKRTCIPSHDYRNAVIAVCVLLAFASTAGVRTRSKFVRRAISDAITDIPLFAMCAPGCRNAETSIKIASDNRRTPSSERTQSSARVYAINRGLFFTTAYREATAQ